MKMRAYRQAAEIRRDAARHGWSDLEEQAQRQAFEIELEEYLR
jgi:hypothetical protein